MSEEEELRVEGFVGSGYQGGGVVEREGCGVDYGVS